MRRTVPDEVARLVELAEVETWTSVYEAAHPGFAAAMRLRVERVSSARLLMMPALDNDFYNRVVGLGVGEPATEEMIDEIIECYRQAGYKRVIFNVSPKARPAAVHGWILERGAFPVSNWIKLFRDNAMPPFVATDLAVQRIGPEHAEAFGWLSTAVFGVPEELQPLTAATVGRPGWHHYLAFEGDFPAACGAMFLHGETAWLGFGGTLDTHRRRGAQGAILTARIYDGLQMGARWFTSDTDDFTPDQPNPSFNNLARLGFQTAYLRPNYLLYL